MKETSDAMVFAIATRHWEKWAECVETWRKTATATYHEHLVVNRNLLDAYQEAVSNTTEPIIAFIHDDVMIYERGWDNRVLKEFFRPGVGLVGFGGGLRHGSVNLYRVPYQLSQLGRSQFRSNLRNAEAHGQRFTGECDVAVLDGFAMFVRRSILEQAGGWPLGTKINTSAMTIGYPARPDGKATASVWWVWTAITCRARRRVWSN